MHRTTRQRGRSLAAAAVLAVVALGCAACLPRDVGILASADFDGRRSGEPGGVKARDWIVGQLRSISTGANTSSTGAGSYLQRFGGRANVLAVIRGTNPDGRYVMVGAHYDHLGHSCRTAVPADTLCNGATDNASGVATVLQLARRLHEAPARRTVVVVLWDGEEQQDLGSNYYVAHPLFPLATAITYVNLDILGANLTPGLRTTTFAVGPETGGTRLRQAVDAADAATPLDVLSLSVVFGEGRSDHAPFVKAKVPTVFFGDSSGGCYHTAQDDVDVVDFAKLREQAELVISLTRSLAKTTKPPVFDATAPVTSYADVVEFERVVDRAWPDRALFSTADQATFATSRDTVHRIVDDGSAAFGTDDVGAFLSSAQKSASLLSHLACDGFLADS